MIYVPEDDNKADKANLIFDRLQDIAYLTKHPTEPRDKQYTENIIEQNKAYVKWLLSDYKGLDKEIKKIFQSIKDTDLISLEMRQISDDERLKLMPAVLNNLFSYQEKAFLDSVEKIYTPLAEEVQQAVEQE